MKITTEFPALDCAWNIQHGYECTTLCAHQSDFSKIVNPYGNERLFRPVEAARRGKFDFGADMSRKEGFSSKTRSDRAQVHLFAVSMYQNHVVSDYCCGTPFCAETALVHIFDLFFAGSRLLPILWCHICTVFIKNFLFIHNYVTTLS